MMESLWFHVGVLLIIVPVFFLVGYKIGIWVKKP